VNESAIPEDIKCFLLVNIDSIAQWEALLLLRSNPEKEWSAQALARNIYTDEHEMEHLLKQLAERDVLITQGSPPSVSYRYCLQNSELVQIINRTADLYRSGYLIPITHIIHSKSKSKIQQFADAFKIRKD
jgi:hypothetical protein